MKNNKLIFLGVLIFVSIVVFAIIFYKQYYLPKYNWQDQFTKNSEEPYGQKLFFELIKKQAQPIKIINNQQFVDLLDTNQTNTNYISVNNGISFDSITALHLLKYINKGNNALIASSYSPLELLRFFVPIADTIYGFDEKTDSIIKINFDNPGSISINPLKFHFQYQKDTIAYNWAGYNNVYFKDTLTKYGFISYCHLNDSLVNIFYVPYGKGKLIIHANPILFTNYYFIKKEGFLHHKQVLSLLNKGPIYWNEPNENNSIQNTQGTYPLKFLFSSPYLRYAWYLLLLSILLYIIFRSKRMQRVIPITPKNKNSTIGLIKAIGTLYHQNKNKHYIGTEMYLIFLTEARTRYNIQTDTDEKSLISVLSDVSKVDKNVINNLFRQFNKVRFNENARSEDVISLYNMINNYHKRRK
ncbi:MAG: hypothetical protein EAZ07_04845 [Cytophagales bacterium]|nr:MAG: hypothetical protein EAZ07_04845 [Cytophagales bacterium]